MIKRGLGRGLDALLPPAEARAGAIEEIPVEAIVPSGHQPRKELDEQGLEELAASLKRSGLLQPVIVRRRGDGYQLVVGERRWRAARRAGLARIPAIVRETSDAEALELALAENLLREDLNPMEEAEAYQRLLAEFGWSQEDLAQRIGKDRSSVANSLRLLRLPPIIQDDLRRGRLTMGHARALLGLATAREQLRLREQILAQDWSVRATEERVRRSRRTTPRAPRRPPEVEALEDDLRSAFGTKVRVVGTLERGRIELHYVGAEQLNRLRDQLVFSK
ncbi:MAG: ParB/RepB/Spo0J family partition protein [Candidatus Rokubacteria bacterium]|nr:ParB/RepB/Spo0J family partition protein [Candidatus Rokubacteria bacterium]MBI2878881.1 ParB/RepB/Spo0J family partition protein [Candidatus Rokubacteria bacterium]